MHNRNGIASYRVETPATFQVASLKRLKGISAYALSPNGERLPIKVVENDDGIYSTHFTPYETGMWQVHILDDHEHIEGSPFQFRVWDVKKLKISGLESTFVGRDVSLQVEAESDDLEKVSVKVKAKGHDVDCRMKRISSKIVSLNFRPVRPATHLVHVFLNDEEIKDSPFELEVKDTGGVVVTGVGISEAPTQQSSLFYVNIGREGSSSDLEVNIISPRNTQVPFLIHDNKNGNLTVEYTPYYTGEHCIEILYFNKPVPGSPFFVNVFDPQNVILSNVPSEVLLHETVQFDIDASNAGYGNLEISINGGDCLCQVDEVGRKKYSASFTPITPRPHFLSVNFNKIPVPGSPCCVQVIKVSNLTFFEPQQNLFPIGQPLEFNVQSDYNDLDFKASVKTPSGLVMQAEVFSLQNKLFRIRFVPPEIGSHTIDFTQARNGAVRAKPFHFRVFDPRAVAVSPVNAGVVGSAVEFSVDASHAGEGQLEICIDRGATPHKVQMYGKGKFLVSFTPHAAGNSAIDILFNGHVLSQCPILVPVLDPSPLPRSLEETEQNRSVVNKSASFQLRHRQKENAKGDLSIKVTAPNGEVVPSKLLLEENGDYKVEYSSHCTGRHAVDIRQSGISISGSPFFVEIFDPSKIKIVGDRSGEVGCQMELEVICSEAGKADLKVHILSPRGHKVPYEVFKTSVGEHIRYVPRETGVYSVTAQFGGLSVPGPPVKQVISDARLISATGEGLVSGTEDQQSKFVVDTRGQEGDLFVRVEGPKSVAICNIDRLSDGKYSVRYTPAEVGVFKVNIKWNDKDLPDSPFKPVISNYSKIFLVGGWQPFLDPQGNLILPSDKPLHLIFDISAAGPGSLKVELDDGAGVERQPSVQLDPNHIRVTVMPMPEGEYRISFKWRDKILENLPTRAISRIFLTKSISDITETTFYSKKESNKKSDKLANLILTGRGLQHAILNDPTQFIIDSVNVEPGTPEVTLLSTRSNEEVPVTVQKFQDQKYKCIYTPKTEGAHLLHVKWSDRAVVGSPFKVEVSKVADASRVVVDVESMKEAWVGKDIQTTIDTSSAGRGVLTAECIGPNQLALSRLIDHYDGTFTLLVRPQQHGLHVLRIMYNGVHIRGSPFTLMVFMPPDASKVKVTGHGIRSGYLGNYIGQFTVNTRGAGTGELTVRVRGPRGGFHVEMAPSANNDRHMLCSYNPTEPGNYVIDVTWSGVQVVGSPFLVYVAKTVGDLRKHLKRQKAVVAFS